jgi:hypothetical protein
MSDHRVDGKFPWRRRLASSRIPSDRECTTIESDEQDATTNHAGADDPICLAEGSSADFLFFEKKCQKEILGSVLLWKFSLAIRVPTPSQYHPARRIIAPVATLRSFPHFINRPKINREKF